MLFSANPVSDSLCWPVIGLCCTCALQIQKHPAMLQNPEFTREQYRRLDGAPTSDRPPPRRGDLVAPPQLTMPFIFRLSTFLKATSNNFSTACVSGNPSSSLGSGEHSARCIHPTPATEANEAQSQGYSPNSPSRLVSGCRHSHHFFLHMAQANHSAPSHSTPGIQIKLSALAPKV